MKKSSLVMILALVGMVGCSSGKQAKLPVLRHPVDGSPCSIQAWASTAGESYNCVNGKWINNNPGFIMAADGGESTIQYQAISPASTTGPITVKDIRADVPEFRREYTVMLPRDIAMKITIRSTYYSYSGYSLSTQGELTQPGGRWVLFEPERPADKILDRELLPSVEAYCDEILAQDRQFRHSKPGEFTDESGVIWIRKSVEKAK